MACYEMLDIMACNEMLDIMACNEMLDIMACNEMLDIMAFNEILGIMACIINDFFLYAYNNSEIFYQLCGPLCGLFFQ